LRNSSSARHVDAFYIDHSASSSNGGFIITTTDRRTKNVTGFSRFELTLPPGEEIDFTVEEEVTFTTQHTTVSDIKNQLKSRTVGPVVPSTLRDDLERLIVRDSVLNMMRRITSSSDILDFSNDVLEQFRNQVVEFFNLSSTSPLLADMDAALDLINQARSIRANETMLTRQIALETKSIDTVVHNQKRLRENLEMLKEHGNSSLVRRYLDDMNNDEDTLKESRRKVLELTEEREGLSGKRGELQQKIKKKLDTLSETFSDDDAMKTH
jgi:vacuolar-type H+-ATPase subunit I/STV1